MSIDPSGEDAIRKRLDVDTSLAVTTNNDDTGANLEEVYEIERTVREIKEGGFRKIALQFPDSLLPDSVPVYLALRERLPIPFQDFESTKDPSRDGDDDGKEIWVMADSSYSSCCVDEVSAHHVDADLIVHYGHACLSPTSLPVIYIFPHLPIPFLSSASTSTSSDDHHSDDLETAFQSLWTALFDWIEEEDKDRDKARARDGPANQEIKDGEYRTEKITVALVIEQGYLYEQERIFSHFNSSFSSQPITSRKSRYFERDRNHSHNAKDVAENQNEEEESFNNVEIDLILADPPRSSKPKSNDGATKPSGEREKIVEEEEQEVETRTRRKKGRYGLPEGFIFSSSSSSSSGSNNTEESFGKRVIFHIGGEKEGRDGERELVNLRMECEGRDVGLFLLGLPSLSIHPPSSPLSSSTRLLMRRYGVIQKARDCDVFGLLVNTGGMASHLPLLSHLRHLLSSPPNFKKSYTLSVGKLNPAKLANFMEVECWVVVGCSEGGGVVGQTKEKDYHCPMITPFELSLALEPPESPKAWNGTYLVDYASHLNTTKGWLLKDDKAKRNGDLNNNNDNINSEVVGENGNFDGREEDEQEEEVEEDEDEEKPVFSAATGTYRKVRRFGKEQHDGARHINGTNTKAVAIRDENNKLELARAINSPAAQHLSTRHFQGLDPRYGRDAPAEVEKGRAGLARGYGHEDETREEYGTKKSRMGMGIKGKGNGYEGRLRKVESVEKEGNDKPNKVESTNDMSW